MQPHQNARIAIDFDGTLARVNDFACAVLTALGHPRTARDLLTYGHVRETPEMERAFWAAYDILDAMPHIRAALEPYDSDAGIHLTHIVKRYPRTRVVSANEPIAAYGIHRWLNRVAPVASLTLDTRVHCIGRHGPSKATLGYDILIDDSPGLAADCPVVRRWRSWSELPDLVDRAARAVHAGAVRGPVLLLANARWNEDVEDRGCL